MWTDGARLARATAARTVYVVRLPGGGAHGRYLAVARRSVRAGRQPTAASSRKPGTSAAETTVELGSACDPNRWSTATLTDSSTQNVVRAAAAAVLQPRLRHRPTATTAAAGSQRARSWTHTGLVATPRPSVTSCGWSPRTAGTIDASQSAALASATSPTHTARGRDQGLGGTR